MGPAALWSVSFQTAAAHVEAFAAALENGALSVSTFAPPRTAKARIEALYDAAPDAAALTARLAVIAALHKTKAPSLRIKPLPKLDWLRKVAADFPPLPVARWLIHGARHRAAAAGHRLALQIDASSAFGTGEHPTTRGCLLMLDKILKKSRRHSRMLDLGCGSGILALAWAKARRKPAIAVDLDPEAVRIARENMRVNGARNFARTGLSRGYNASLVRRHAPYDLIMANIFAGPLCQLAKDLKRHLRPGGYAILAGMLMPQANRVLAAHRRQKLFLVSRLTAGEWPILLLQRRRKY